MPSPDRHFANAAIFTQSTGVTPNSGDAALYIKTDNKLYVKNSSGTEAQVTADMVGATSSAAGTAGLVPQPAAGKNTRVLSSDATFREPAILPQFKPANNIWVQSIARAATGNGNFNARVRTFAPIYVPSDGNIDTLGFATGSGAISVAFNVHLAIWEANEDGTVGSYIQGATVSSGTTSNVSVSVGISQTAVKRGYYYISFTSDANIPSNGIRVTTSTGLIQYLGTNDLNASSSGARLGYTATTYDQITHETFTIDYGNGWASVGFQYA